MMLAVVDTNVFVRGMIAAHPQSSSQAILNALINEEFFLALSLDAYLEIEHVLSLQTMRDKHQWSDDRLQRLLEFILFTARFFEPHCAIPPSVTRDPSDSKWIELALESQADFLVTDDMRHLGRLKAIGPTKIVSPGAFAKALGAEK